LVIAICAVICGADSWEDIEDFGKSKKEWLEGFLELADGIASHDTFARIFARINAEEFQGRFLRWVEFIAQKTEQEIVAIDEKKLRRSFDSAFGKSAIHMVSAWAANNRLVLGQVKVEDKSNEITAIPELLKLLEINGCIVTIDAMGCQKEIAATIIEQGGDYVLSLKDNQAKQRCRVIFSNQ
jgi:predicted transposase YbfD/YdcC